MSKARQTLSILDTFATPAAPAPNLTQEYLNLLLAKGLVEGVGAHATFDTQARQILSALHHILAGGQVEIHLTTPGAREAYDALEHGCDQAGTSFRAGPSIAVAAP